MRIDQCLRASGLPRREAEMLLGHQTGLSRVAILAHPESTLDPATILALENLFARRRAGEPIAYLNGQREFYGREFTVTPDVLIPRPETETIVEIALARLRAVVPPATPINVLDLGTGSGVLAITLALELAGSGHAAKVLATDLSLAALNVAAGNASRLGAAIRFQQSDWFAALGTQTFALIVSNPPYVAAGDPHLAKGDLRFEPPGALSDGVPGAGGLACITTITRLAPQHLRVGGWLLVEHGWDQAAACRELFAQAGLVDVESVRDLAGIERVCVGRK